MMLNGSETHFFQSISENVKFFKMDSSRKSMAATPMNQCDWEAQFVRLYGFVHLLYQRSLEIAIMKHLPEELLI